MANMIQRWAKYPVDGVLEKYIQGMNQENRDKKILRIISLGLSLGNRDTRDKMIFPERFLCHFIILKYFVNGIFLWNFDT